ncbi:MAG: CRISPR-associated helicase Cas3' [Archaeoglobaceae archaeon]|nr:CRISPR-associated helicase Cas3' [Archaeoglobaceae archaeon]
MDTRELFKKLTGYDAYDYQIRAWEKIHEIMEDGGKVIIEVQTAGGKTETAIMPFLREMYNETWSVSRLIYVLPTRSLVEKQAERIRKLVEKLYSLKGYPNAEKISEKSVLVEYGLEKTHAFLGNVILTTWDSFLYGIAAHRTVGNRFTFPAGSIAQSLVVFDEVQMYQDFSLYMPRILALVIKMLKKAKVPVVVMSATIPSKLIDIIAEGAVKVEVHDSDKLKPLRGEVKVEISESFDKLFGVVVDTLKTGKRVLVVRNTVDRARNTYEKLKSLKEIQNKKIILIHSRFTVEDRKRKELRLEEADLIVATQVVESGLDFEKVALVITDIAPLDALIQRIGRCARRSNEKGKAIILIESAEREPREVKKKSRSPEFVRGFREILEKLGIEEEKVSGIRFENCSLVFNRVGEKKEIKVTSSYPCHPYDPLVLMRTFDELENPKKIEEFLLDVKITREALDRVYRYHYEKNIVPKEYYSAYLYFRELKLFSLPPEYELRARPELYSMLYIGGECFDAEKIIRVEYNWLRNKEKIIESELKVDEEGRVKVEEFRGVKPLVIYKLKGGFYDPEIGVVEP